MPVTVLVTGFGPFPGAPFNPTERLVTRLARLRRPATADAKIVSHIFTTSYAAVDEELPKLIAKHRPDALLMFGLATRTKTLRVETRARNSVLLIPDATGKTARRTVIRMGAPASCGLPGPTQKLLGVLRGAQVPVRPSRDAGRYLCNYLCWQAAEATRKKRPRLAAFIHVPQVRRGARPKRRDKAQLSIDDLIRAGACAMATIVAEARR